MNIRHFRTPLHGSMGNVDRDGFIVVAHDHIFEATLGMFSHFSVRDATGHNTNFTFPEDELLFGAAKFGLASALDE